jgi:AP endonuclease-1
MDLALKARFPHSYWSISDKKTYCESSSAFQRVNGNLKSFLAGTAILSKHKPLSVTTTLPGHPDPTLVKGRIVTLEFENCFVVGTYTVNAGADLKVWILDPAYPWV